MTRIKQVQTIPEPQVEQVAEPQAPKEFELVFNADKTVSFELTTGDKLTIREPSLFDWADIETAVQKAGVIGNVGITLYTILHICTDWNGHPASLAEMKQLKSLEDLVRMQKQQRPFALNALYDSYDEELVIICQGLVVRLSEMYKMCLVCSGGFDNPHYSSSFEGLEKLPTSVLLYRFQILQKLNQEMNPQKVNGKSIEDMVGA